MNSPNNKVPVADAYFCQQSVWSGIDAQTTHHQVLTIDRIKPYDRNPRRTINPLYNEIKASIRAKCGLNSLLTVTQRPEDTDYMVAAGGNTRLLILKELWAELTLDCFYHIHCLVVPWLSDSQALSAHLIENELRGEMTLIDKALALRDLKIQLEHERGQSLSGREFSRRLKQLGYPISPRQLTRFNYAAERLEPLIPIALAAGLGSFSIEKLRKIEAAYSKCLENFDSTQSFEPLFAQTLLKYDSECLDFEALECTLNNHIAVNTGQPFSNVRLRVEALMLDVSESEPCEFSALGDLAIEPAISAKLVQPVQTVTTPALPTNPGHENPQKEPTGNFDRLSNQSPEKSAEGSDNGLDQPLPFITAPTINTPLHLTDLMSLRNRCYDLAQQISSNLPLPLAVKPWQQGYGFYLDLPEQPIQDEMLYFVFWLLIGLSEQHFSMERVKLAQDMKFAQLILTDQERNAYAVVGSPAPLANLGHSVFLTTKFPENALVTLFQLIQLSRQIRFSFRESDIFECITLEQIRLRDQIAKVADYQITEGDNDE
ncbi:ParB family protein [Methylobacter psychrophilus]|uniref:ParB family protein n=1 Tax=Methylobacter psychrophilus TaxID=96941 RepID=UPI0021D4EA2E|nr:ParB family protein [Methylobacter psychrophilus]